MTETNSNATRTCAYDPTHLVKTQLEVFQKVLLVAEVNPLTESSIPMIQPHLLYPLPLPSNISTTPQDPEIVVSISDEILVTEFKCHRANSIHNTPCIRWMLHFALIPCSHHTSDRD